MENILNELPTIKKQSLLVIEDSEADFDCLKRILTKIGFNYPIYWVTDGEEALGFLYHLGEYDNEAIAPRPTLILLDLNLPGSGGEEVLKQLKEDECLKTIPIVVFTTSPNPKDVVKCYKLGANSYMLKPMKIEVLEKHLRSFISHWFEVVVLPSE